MQKTSLLFFLLLLIFTSCKNSALNDNVKTTFYCNTEVLTKDNGKLCDMQNENITFAGKKLLSNEEAFSGKTSLKLNQKQNYAFSIKLPTVKNKTYKASVWYKGNVEYVSIIVQGNKFYKKSNTIINEKDGWKQILLKFIIPLNYNNNDTIKVYVWNNQKKKVFVDDFKLELVSNEITHIYKETPLRIYIDKKEIEKLHEIRKEAFKKRILETTSDSWVKAVVFYGDKTYKAKLRFKGDWLDHLQGVKWSFRIKLKKNGSFKGMREFSIQTPAARYFIDEWLVHKIFKNEDVLTTRYDFIPVYLNGTNLGLYVYEEHFVKQLIENKQRREGPIIKFTENQMWKARVYYDDKQYPNFLASEVVPFKSSKIVKDEKLKKEFEIAQNIFSKYKYLTNKTSSIFDIDKLAKYLALVDLTRSYHGLIWHNQRFYYNPIIAKLEPIAYDNYCDVGVMQWTKRAIYGNTDISKIGTEPNGFNNLLYLFRDTTFTKKYIYYLQKFTDEDYINKINKTYKKEINNLQKKIKYEFPGYNYNFNFLSSNAKSIRNELPRFISRYNKNKNVKYSEPKFQHNKKYNPKYNKEVTPLYVKAWRNNNKVKVINFHPKEIEIIGLGVNNAVVAKQTNNIVLSYFLDSEIDNVTKELKYLFFKVKGKKDVLYIEINNYKYPNEFNPVEELLTKNKLKENGNFIIKNKDVIFKTGRHVIKKYIIIPAGYRVVFEKGAELDFIENSMFISYSPIFMNGDSINKIIIHSTDGTAKGFSVLQANKKSILNYVEFDNFNTLEYKGWALSGSINFYESDVEITNVSFKNNLCEDALNVVRSNFLVSNCKFNNIFSDAFDSDFSKGILSNTKFNKIGNDAIDFSGSNVNIFNCYMNDIGDKGVSGGEASKLNAENCFVSNATIGFASKDKSKVELINCNVQNCKYGLVALQKKPEYDFAEIVAKNFTWDNIIELYAIEKKSKLTLNKKIIKGNIKQLAKRFY